ncbi:dethiobiotin synthase [Empedobacter brevis]|uniref:dethiobiotin synthase n=1 Tax=Empedobacter brevis TaxID=247 RepID=UPI003342BB7E
MNKKLFVTGIGTGIGKTIVSAILTEALQADYWKPVQSGDLDRSDSELVKSLTSENIIIHQERYQLQLAASPHQSAKKENIEIKLTDFSLPVTSNHLIVEGAGGLFVPLNEKEFMLDVIQHLNLPVVVVSTNYLGCINHTLLSIEALKNRGILIDLFVFNGEFDEDTHQIILKHLPEDIEKIYLPKIDLLTKENLQKIAVTIRKKYI